MRLLIVLLLMLSSFDALSRDTGRRQTNEIPTLTNDANGIFTDQTTGGAATLILDGALSASAAAQLVSIEGSGDNDEVTFTAIGTNADGKRQTEAWLGADNGTGTSTLFFLTVTSITTSGAVDGNVEGGWLSANGAVSASLIPDVSKWSPTMSIVADITGTMTATIEHTQSLMPETMLPVWFDTSGMAAITADAEGNIVAPVTAVRARITAYTSGQLRTTILQGKPQ